MIASKKERARLLGPGGLSIFRSQKKLEARVGFEPTSDGFADHSQGDRYAYYLRRRSSGGAEERREDSADRDGVAAAVKFCYQCCQ